MIFLCGIPSEPSLAMVIEKVHNMGIPYIVFNQRHYTSMNLEFEIINDKIMGTMQIDNRSVPLEHFTAIYTRLMDYQNLPEFEAEAMNSPNRLYCRAVHDTLMRWFEIAPIRVINRNAQIGSIFSKPYQAQLIKKKGFAVPETLITNDPNLVHEFRNKHKRIIYKSISYVRSIVHILENSEAERLHFIRWCPTQFQKFIEGINVRVHTIGDKVFATSINTGAVDYRYAINEAQQEELKEFKLPSELSMRCVELSRTLGLELAGIDLKITPESQVYCLEVNPGPAFSYYEYHTKQPIAQAIAKYLGEFC